MTMDEQSMQYETTLDDGEVESTQDWVERTRTLYPTVEARMKQVKLTDGAGIELTLVDGVLAERSEVVELRTAVGQRILVVLLPPGWDEAQAEMDLEAPQT